MVAATIWETYYSAALSTFYVIYSTAVAFTYKFLISMFCFEFMILLLFLVRTNQLSSCCSVQHIIM